MAEHTPGWHPDPAGRHQHRFWDGTAWTDAVADGGTVGSDPVDLRFAGLPRATTTTTEGVTVTRRSRWPLVAVGAVVALLVLVGGIVLLGGDDTESGTGPTIERVEPGKPVERTIHLHAGEAVGFEVRAPNKDVRFRVAIAVDVETGAAIERTFGSESTDAYGDDLYAAFFPNGRAEHRLLFAGRMRGFYAESFVAPATGDYTLVVRAEEAARVRIDIETQSKSGLVAGYSPVDLYRLRRDAAYKRFFDEWDRRSQGDVSTFTDFSDPYSDEQGTDQMSDYFSEYSDYVDSDYSGYTGDSDASATSS